MLQLHKMLHNSDDHIFHPYCRILTRGQNDGESGKSISSPTWRAHCSLHCEKVLDAWGRAYSIVYNA